jgi:hypothetical protein
MDDTPSPPAIRRTLAAAKTAVAAISLLSAMAGCASGPTGTLIAETRPDLSPQLGAAPQDGQYGLYLAGAMQPMVTFPLKMGERLGFEPLEGGSVGGFRVQYLAAVAGSHVLRLEATHAYQWRRQ